MIFTFQTMACRRAEWHKTPGPNLLGRPRLGDPGGSKPPPPLRSAPLRPHLAGAAALTGGNGGTLSPKAEGWGGRVRLRIWAWGRGVVGSGCSTAEGCGGRRGGVAAGGG
jgi:hypothetical protein